MNIAFEYLYRDAANYKNWNTVVFCNRDAVGPDVLDESVRRVLIDHACFVAEEADVPTMYFARHDEELDHGWHEYAGIRETNEPVTDPMNRDIREFIDLLKIRTPSL